MQLKITIYKHWWFTWAQVLFVYKTIALFKPDFYWKNIELIVRIHVYLKTIVKIVGFLLPTAVL